NALFHRLRAPPHAALRRAHPLRPAMQKRSPHRHLYAVRQRECTPIDPNNSRSNVGSATSALPTAKNSAADLQHIAQNTFGASIAPHERYPTDVLATAEFARNDPLLYPQAIAWKRSSKAG